MGRDPANVRRLVRLNNQYAAAESYAKDVLTGSRVATWHETKFQRSSLPDKVPTGQKPVNRNTAPAVQVEMHDELSELRKTMLEERKIRLKQLLESERLQYEEELNALGLAIEKEAY
uniref:Uncharacterized protein n=1 Tax=Tetraselmis sp. GSL018 TaxID=582737 RepID=A0A061SDY7_9CHLO|mmetsp:Transcript_38524/g.91349  ORF Transcript_38524/g.91349 Transcript_38524/m.91349 type:complete len:117 (-) Transcript_38524:308-658(-)